MMLICDLHCDLPDKILDGATLSDASCHWSLTKLRKEHTYIQTFAHFVDMRKYSDAFSRIDAMLKKFTASLSETDLLCIKTKEDMEACIQSGKNAAILSVEGGEALDGKLENVEYFYNLGVRFLTLTWSLKNELCESCVSGDAPLTPFGKVVVKEMNRLRMTPDVSHMCEKGFWSTIETSTRPVVATHSNAKAICNHARNLTDEQFLAIQKQGGLVGINFYAPFLENDSKNATLNSILNHIEHFLSLGGEDTLCLGGDLDGMPTPAKGIESIRDVSKIAELLSKHYPSHIIEKLMGGNVRRFVQTWF